MDGKNESASRKDEPDEDTSQNADGDDVTRSQGPAWISTTPAAKPATIDRFYYFLPYNEEKPCLWVKGRFEDHRKRLFNSNLIDRVVEKLVSLASKIYTLKRGLRTLTVIAWVYRKMV